MKMAPGLIENPVQCNTSALIGPPEKIVLLLNRTHFVTALGFDNDF